MTKVRAPRKPRGEDLSVTIANQDRQIKVLIDACEGYRKDHDELGRTISHQMGDIARLELELSREKGLNHHLQSVHERMLGYQDCAREIFGMLGKTLRGPGI